MIRKEFVIAHPSGLHARPATLIVKIANRFDCELRITHEGETVDLKSIMGVLSLGVDKGALVVIEAEGEDELRAMEAISDHITEMNIQGKE